MAYSSWSVVFGEQPSAAKWNILGTNDSSFNDGTGIGTNAVAAASLATSAITLGYTQITATVTTSSATYVQATGLTTTVTIPAGGRRIKITAWCRSLENSVASDYTLMSIWDGVVASGTQLSECVMQAAAGTGGQDVPAIAMASVTPSAGSKTYNVGFKIVTGGTASLTASAVAPAFILVEAI